MDYTIGQRIIHPAHGVGQITAIQREELVTGYQRYYVIRFANKQLLVRIPFKRVPDLGLRRIMSKEKAQQVLNVLRALPRQLPSDHKKRQQQVQDLIFSGYPLKIAQAVRELTWHRRRKKRLLLEERRLLDEGRNLLVQEMALALDDPDGKVSQAVDAALATAVAQGEAQGEAQATD